MPRRSIFLVLALCASACRSRPAPPPLADRIDAAIGKGSAYLLARQEADGSIRSDTYAYFKDGYSLTPLVLAALFAVPDDRHAAAYARGVDYLITMLDDGGAPRQDLDAPRYPLYSAALGVLVLNRPDNARHRRTRDALVAELRRLQLGPDLGWKPEDKSYGGWSYFDGLPRRPEVVTEEVAANLSATVYALGALALSGVPPSDPALQRALAFVSSCQAEDGGFFFSPAIADGNKAGPGATPGTYQSYGSMTADGVRALLRLGVAANDPRVTAAAAWLERNFEADRNPGDFPPVNEQRRGSSYFYWTWSAAHALRALGRDTLSTSRGKLRWAEALAEALLARQQADGSWKNPYSEMREDDPIVATSFAVAALGVSRIALGAPYRSHASVSPPAP